MTERAGLTVTKRLLRAHILYGHRAEVETFESKDDLIKRHETMHRKECGHAH